MDGDIVQKVKKFVEDEFRRHPHYSFDDWHIMYDHSVKVCEIANRIAEHLECDRLLVSVGALLHDIGKISEVDEETLHYDHEKLNLTVSEQLLDSLGLSDERLKKLKKIVSYQSNSPESRIIKDADALALYADKRLYMAYIKWAHENKLESAIERKLNKFLKLNFEVSKSIGQEWFRQMSEDWEKHRSVGSAIEL